jgi:hypothetical protein
VCSLFHSLPILLLGPVPAAIAPCDESVSRPEFDVTKATAREVWAQVAATNGVWLQPTAKNLSYAVLGRLIDADTPKPGIASHVWISGTLARWQMDAPKAGWDDEDLSYLLVLTGDSEQYLEAPLQEMIRKPKKARDLRTMVQGIQWRSAVHVLADCGLPERSSIVERRAVQDGHILVLETDLGDARLDVGIGLYHVFFGSFGSPIEKVRLHIKVPEFILVREQFPVCGAELEYEPDFLEIGNQRAPKTIRLITQLNGSPWVLESHYRKLNDLWLVEKAYNIYDETKLFEMVVFDVSTEPIDAAVFAPAKP